MKKFDSQKMYVVYDNWPQIAKESFQVGLDNIDFKDVNHIVFSGMGGSGAIGDIFSAIFSKTDIHVNVVKGYLLPKTVNSNTLIISTSISGDTDETLTVLESAKKSGCKIVAFSSGGKMENFCNQNNIEYRKVPFYHSPRASFPSFLYSMLKSLAPILPIKKEEINESINQLENLARQISSSNLNEKNPALSFATWLNGIQLIYYPKGLEAAAIRFKNSLQENAKTHAMIEDVIEACHNGIVSWERSSNVKPILIEGTDDYVKTKERWQIIKNYFEINNIEYREVFSLSGNIVTKLINLIYLLDYSTIYHAILSSIDPSPIKSIDFVKNKLGHNL